MPRFPTRVLGNSVPFPSIMKFQSTKYTDVSQSEWIHKTECVDILSLASSEVEPSIRDGYPGWVPSFSEHGPLPLFERNALFHASKSYTASIKGTNSSEQVLCLAGVVLDQIRGGDRRFSSPPDPRSAEQVVDDYSSSIAVLWDQYCSLWPLSAPLNDIPARFKHFLLTLGAPPPYLEGA